jgi:hypothetical protein
MSSPPGQPQQQHPGLQQKQPQQHPQQHPQQPHPGFPPQQQQQQLQHPPQQAAVSPTDNGAFPGGTYSISHRDTNAVLALTLQQGASVKSKSGAMIHMSSTIQLQGKIKFSMKKLITGSDLSESTYVGPGRVAVGPTLFGDIITLHVDGRTNWTIGKDSFLASTIEVKRETKAQGISKALFSGEDLFVYRLTGQGIIWLTSFGAVDRLDVSFFFSPLSSLLLGNSMFANLFLSFNLVSSISWTTGTLWPGAVSMPLRELVAAAAAP